MKIIKYKHHGNEVFVREDLKGRHREHCLCCVCQKFFPDDVDKNCIIAREVFSICLKLSLVLPVWECQYFIRKTCLTCLHGNLSNFIKPCRDCKDDAWENNKTKHYTGEYTDFKTKWEPKEERKSILKKSGRV